MKDKVKTEIDKVVKELFQKEVSFSIEYPESKFGDYSSNVAFSLSKLVGINPREVAEKIADFFGAGNSKIFKKVEVAGPGFLNFFIRDEIFSNNISSILKLGKKYGQNKVNKGKKIIVEYSSPNIAKPFTIGHLRSTIIGDALSNILEASGAKVIRDNHLGDWGTQFGKMIVAIKKWGNVSEIKKSKQPVKDLVALYVKFHDEAEKDKLLEDEARSWFTKLEKKDKEATKLWKLCVELSSKEFEKIYKRLGVSFDTAVGESFFEDKMKVIVDEAKEKGIAKVSEGATLVFFENGLPAQAGKLPPLMLLKSDGSSLYALRDLATDKWRKKKYGKDVVIINEVGAEQSLHFKQLFEAEKLLGISNGHDRMHIAHGLYSFKDGKMSTRKGNVIWLEEVLEEAKKRAEVFNKDVAEEVGIGALKFNDLKRDSTKEIVFDWNEILNLGGDSGPYLQYSSARAFSILEKSKKKPKGIVPTSWQITDVEKILLKFGEVLERSALELKPHQLALYLLDLAGAFNNFYTHNKIIGSEDESYKLAITEAFRTVLSNGLNLLGIKSLKKM